MKPAEKLDLKLQGEILRLGMMLDAAGGRSVRTRTPPSGQPQPEQITAKVEQITTAIGDHPTARKILGIKRRMDAETARLRISIVACLAWRALRQANIKSQIAEVAGMVADPNASQIEAFLSARNEVGQLILEDVIVGSADLEDKQYFWVELPTVSLEWLSGGANQLGYLTVRRASRMRSSNGVEQEEGTATEVKPIPTARALYEQARQICVGIDSELKTLASRIVLHAIRAEALSRGLQDNGIGNQVILITGASGSGKTFAVEEMAKFSQIPFVSFDASTITGEGWAGAKVEDALKQLAHLPSLKGDFKKATRGIVFYDEVDKILKAGDAQHRLAVAGEFLRPLGGARIIIGGKRMQDCKPFIFDCKPTCFVLAGVFDGLAEIIERSSGRRKMGFSSVEGEKKLIQTREALKFYGVIDELANRISCCIHFPRPTASGIATAIVSEQGIITGYNMMLAGRGIVIFPTQNAVSLLAQYAVETRQYYRGVKHLIGSVIEEILFDGTGGTTMLDSALIRRAIDRTSAGIDSCHKIESPSLPNDPVPDEIQCDTISDLDLAGG